MYKSLLSFALLGALLGACSGGATGSTCPTTDAPTYASFGQAFFAKYCTQCHSATANDRHDAPNDQNYDTEAEIKQHASDIDGVAAKGPSATNTSMPELGSVVKTEPTDAERTTLGQYLACAQAN